MANPAAEFRELALERLDALPAGEFAGVFCIGNVLAHVSAAELPRFLEMVRRRLQPGGVWIFQTVNFDRLTGRDTFDFPVIEAPEQDLVFERRYRDIRPDGLRFLTRLTIAGREHFAGEVKLYPLRTREAEQRHREAGFLLRDHLADFAGSAFDPERSGGSVFVFATPES
jgi:hypothetical protein